MYTSPLASVSRNALLKSIVIKIHFKITQRESKILIPTGGHVAESVFRMSMAPSYSRGQRCVP